MKGVNAKSALGSIYWALSRKPGGKGFRIRPIAYLTVAAKECLEAMAEEYPETTIAELREISERLYPLGEEEIKVLKELELKGWGHLRSSMCFCDWLFNAGEKDLAEAMDRIAWASKLCSLNTDEQIVYARAYLESRKGREWLSKAELMELAGIKREASADKVVGQLVAVGLMTETGGLYKAHLMVMSEGWSKNTEAIDTYEEGRARRMAKRREKAEKKGV